MIDYWLEKIALLRDGPPAQRHPGTGKPLPEFPLLSCRSVQAPSPATRSAASARAGPREGWMRVIGESSTFAGAWIGPGAP